MNTAFIFAKLKKGLNIKNFFKEDDTRFMLLCALKITTVSILVFALITYLIWIVLTYNSIFFEANGFPITQETRQAFFDSVITNALSRLQLFFAYLIMLFWLGIYIGAILLRPFRNISKYCQEAMQKNNVEYNPEPFSDFRLLTRFGEFFFQYLADSRRDGKLLVNSIPPHYQRIHRPEFDKVFFLHFFLVLIGIAFASSFFITSTVSDMYEDTINLALNTLKISNNSVRYFLQRQDGIFESLNLMTLLAIFISYFALAHHLYGQVSGPAFGFFTTMRAYMKGKLDSRVHLLGYSHIRPYSRMFNKYLDQVNREIVAESEKISK